MDGEDGSVAHAELTLDEPSFHWPRFGPRRFLNSPPVGGVHSQLWCEVLMSMLIPAGEGGRSGGLGRAGRSGLRISHLSAVDPKSPLVFCWSRAIVTSEMALTLTALADDTRRGAIEPWEEGR